MTATINRPEPPYDPGEDLEWVAKDDPDFVVLDQASRVGRLCRARSCMRPVVVILKRQHRGAKSGWAAWACCSEHMYGRWIEGDRTMMWTLIRKVKP